MFIELKFRKKRKVKRERTRYTIAHGEWISGESISTGAKRTVVINTAFSICSANVNAWIHTFLINAGFIAITFGRNYTLWSASWSTSNETRQTRANSNSIIFSALTIRAAWITSAAWIFLTFVTLSYRCFRREKLIYCFFEPFYYNNHIKARFEDQNVL